MSVVATDSGRRRATPAKKSPVRKSPAKKSAVRKSPAKKSATKKATAKKAATKEPSAKKAATKKVTAKATTKRSIGPVSTPSIGVTGAPTAAAEGRGSSRAWPNAPLRRGLGVALLGLAGAGRFGEGANPVVGPGAPLPAEPVVDVALGALDVAMEVGERVSRSAERHLDPLLTRAWSQAPTVSGTAGAGLRVLAALTEPLAARGRRLRADAEHEAAAAVASVLPETIRLVMEQLDLTELAIENVDIERVLTATADQVDLTGFAIEHMDLVRLIEASLDEVDFTGLAITRLDFARAVTAALEQVDILAVTRDQMDPARVAQFLRENVDVSEALRAAPSSVAGEAVRGARQTLGRLAGRR